MKPLSKIQSGEAARAPAPDLRSIHCSRMMN